MGDSARDAAKQIVYMAQYGKGSLTVGSVMGVIRAANAELQPYGDDVALVGSKAPRAERIEDLIRYCLTVRKRFGNTVVTFSLKWGGSALWARDALQKLIDELEAKEKQ